MINWKVDFYIGLSFLALSLVVFAVATTYPRLAAMFPIIISLTLAGLALLLMFCSFRRKNDDSPDNPIEHNIIIVSKIVSGLIVYILVIKWAGYIISTFSLIAYTTFVLGYPKIKTLLITSAVTVLTLYTVFNFFLGTPLPQMAILELFEAT